MSLVFSCFLESFLTMKIGITSLRFWLHSGFLLCTIAVSLSHSCPPEETGGITYEAVRHSHQHLLLPHSTLSKTEEWPQCHNGPLLWHQPCRLWCLCHLQEPSYKLLSSPGHRSSLEGLPEAAGSAGHRRWQWGQNGVLQSHYLGEKCKC